jgi:hypothetical protein
MGNCQNEFENVPDLDQGAEDNKFLNNSIKQTHKTVRPNSQEIVFGVLGKKTDK